MLARLPKPLLMLLGVLVLLGGYLLGNEYRYWRDTSDLPEGSREAVLLPKDTKPRWSLLWAPDGDERACNRFLGEIIGLLNGLAGTPELRGRLRVIVVGHTDRRISPALVQGLPDFETWNPSAPVFGGLRDQAFVAGCSSSAELGVADAQGQQLARLPMSLESDKRVKALISLMQRHGADT